MKYTCKNQKTLFVDCPTDKNIYELCLEFCKEMFAEDKKSCKKCLKIVEEIQKSVKACIKYSDDPHSSKIFIRDNVLNKLISEGLIKEPEIA